MDSGNRLLDGYSTLIRIDIGLRLLIGFGLLPGTEQNLSLGVVWTLLVRYR